ncbi:MAG: hypothetical protein ABEJ72_01355, partial [Candidatus Aenigmatarchaeota archaeon]
MDEEYFEVEEVGLREGGNGGVFMGRGDNEGVIRNRDRYIVNPLRPNQMEALGSIWKDEPNVICNFIDSFTDLIDPEVNEVRFKEGVPGGIDYKGSPVAGFHIRDRNKVLNVWGNITDPTVLAFPLIGDGGIYASNQVSYSGKRVKEYFGLNPSIKQRLMGKGDSIDISDIVTFKGMEDISYFPDTSEFEKVPDESKVERMEKDRVEKGQTRMSMGPFVSEPKDIPIYTLKDSADTEYMLTGVPNDLFQGPDGGDLAKEYNDIFTLAEDLIDEYDIDISMTYPAETKGGQENPVLLPGDSVIELRKGEKSSSFRSGGFGVGLLSRYCDEHYVGLVDSSEQDLREFQ